MGRCWSLLFLLVPVLGVATMVCGIAGWPEPFYDHWLPEDVSEHGHVIDDLFMFILYLTGVIFIATGFALFWFLWKYDADNNPQPVKFMHGSHTLEIIWSILPAATLLFIAVYQMNAWADARMRRPEFSLGADKKVGGGDDVIHAEVTGSQFRWDIRYPGPDGRIGTPDDIYDINELHVPVDQEVVLSIKSEDVLHSFFLPNLRLKQDVVPGMKQYVWFKAEKPGTYDIVCAELCGWGHYKMRGRLIVEEKNKSQDPLKDNFTVWLEKKRQQQEQSQFSPSDDEEE